MKKKMKKNYLHLRKKYDLAWLMLLLSLGIISGCMTSQHITEMYKEKVIHTTILNNLLLISPIKGNVNFLRCHPVLTSSFNWTI